MIEANRPEVVDAHRGSRLAPHGSRAMAFAWEYASDALRRQRLLALPTGVRRRLQASALTVSCRRAEAHRASAAPTSSHPSVTHQR